MAKPIFERPIITRISEALGQAELKALEESRRQIIEEMERDRIEARWQRAQDPNRCHCPHCYVIG